MNITEPKPYLNQGSGYTEPKPWCGFTEVRHFGTPDKHGFSYHTEKCGCRESCDIPAMLNLAGENYLYRNDKDQTVVGYHALMDNGDEHPIYLKIAEIQYEVWKTVFNKNYITLATKKFYEKVDEIVNERYVKKDSRFSTLIKEFVKVNPQTSNGVF
jgi:hypothetical protein